MKQEPVAPISKSAGAFKRTTRVERSRPGAGLETRDTADLEVCATKAGWMTAAFGNGRDVAATTDAVELIDGSAELPLEINSETGSRFYSIRSAEASVMEN